MSYTNNVTEVHRIYDDEASAKHGNPCQIDVSTARDGVSVDLVFCFTDRADIRINLPEEIALVFAQKIKVSLPER